MVVQPPSQVTKEGATIKSNAEKLLEGLQNREGSCIAVNATMKYFQYTRVTKTELQQAAFTSFPGRGRMGGGKNVS